MNNINKSKEVAINIRTSEEIKKQFNEMIKGGATQTEKFEYLMSLYNESLGRQARLDIEDELKAIEVKFSEMTNVIENIKMKSNEWQTGIVDCYVNGLGEEFNILKEEIEFDEEAKSRVEDLEKENARLMEKLSEERDRLAQASAKVKELEEENKELVKEESRLIKESAKIQAQAMEDSAELISVKSKLEDRIEQLESANKELTELRKIKYQYEELQEKYNDLLKKSAAAKTTKANTKTNKSEETK